MCGLQLCPHGAIGRNIRLTDHLILPSRTWDVGKWNYGLAAKYAASPPNMTAKISFPHRVSLKLDVAEFPRGKEFK